MTLSGYPGSLDTIADDKVDATPTAADHAPIHNLIADSIMAVQSTLGINPQGLYPTVQAALAGKVDMAPTASQVILGTGDITALVVKATSTQNLANVFEMRLNNNAIAAFIDRFGSFSAQALKVGGAALASTHLADGAQLARLSSPTFTGTPAAPTAAVDTNTTQLATTAFVIGQAASVLPLMDGAAQIGSSLRYARADHIHASDTSRLALSGGTMTGKLTVAAAGIGFNDGSTQTTAPQPGVQVVTALPVSPTDGLTVLLKLGTTPFSTIMLTWDNALGKWVSEEWQVKSYEWAISHNTTISTVSGSEFVISMDHAAKVSAGLKLQIRIIWAWANFSNSVGIIYFQTLGSSEGDSGPWATSFSEINGLSVTLTSSPRFTSHCDLGANEWRDVNSTHNAKQVIGARFQVQSNASPNFTTTQISAMQVRCRYVSA